MDRQDISRAAFEEACLDASAALMNNARRKNNPKKMIRHAMAAQYASVYARCITGVFQDKMLAAFDFSDASSLSSFIKGVAKAHAARDFESGAIDFTSFDFAPAAVYFAGVVASIELYSPFAAMSGD